jgi:hypothetical protein
VALVCILFAFLFAYLDWVWAIAALLGLAFIAPLAAIIWQTWPRRRD